MHSTLTLFATRKITVFPALSDHWNAIAVEKISACLAPFTLSIPIAMPDIEGIQHKWADSLFDFFD